MDTILPTEPSSYKTLITASLRLYRASFKYVCILSLFLSFVTFIPRFLSDVIGQDIFLRLSPLAPQRLWLIVIEFGGLILFIALLWRIHCVMKNKHEPFIEDMVMGLKKFFSAWIATVLSSALVLALILIIYAILVLFYEHIMPNNTSILSTLWVVLIFCIQFLLVTYAITLFIFVIPLIATENNGIIASIEHSIGLIWNHWWRTLSVQITPWITYFIVILLIKYVAGINIHLYFIGNRPHTFISTIINLIIFAIYIPWVASLLLLQLRDLELRKRLPTPRMP